MTDRPRVHVLDPIHSTAMERLREEVEVMTADIPFPSDCDAVIVRTRAISAVDIASCPNLKVIGKHGVGLDAIDLEAARKRDIAVLSTPGANAESVADLAIGFALMLLRNISSVSRATRAGKRLSPSQEQGFELAELKIGILGIGIIGTATARRLVRGFGASVQAYDPGIPEDRWPQEIARVETLANLLQTSQLLFVHAPLVPATRRVIDAAALGSMPRGAYVVNCARGGIVDETALSAALASGHIAGAACDVFEQEPPVPENALFNSPGFLATPHIGGNTNGALRRVGLSITQKVLDHLRQGREMAEPQYVTAFEEKKT